MKNFKMISLCISIFCVMNSHSMEEYPKKRDRDKYEQKVEPRQKETNEPELKKYKSDDSYNEICAEENDNETILPTEVIEHILFLCMISIFEDAIDALEKSATDYSAEQDDLEHNPPFKKWLENTPYPKMVLTCKSFSEKSLCRKLMQADCFKRNLHKHIKKTLVRFFKINDNWASKFLRDIIQSVDMSQFENQGSRFGILLFARCLANSGIHPNQVCYQIQDGNRKEIVRTDLTKPFCLLEFALYIAEPHFAYFLTSDKDGDAAKVSKNLNCLTMACRNDAIEIYKLIKENAINWFRQPITEGLIEAIKNKSYKVLAEAIRLLIELSDIELLKVLIDNGLDVNQSNSHVYEIIDEEPFFITDEETPLMFAVRAANFEVAKKLIEEWRADVNAKTDYGTTALHSATICNEEDGLRMAQYLIEKGAKVSAEEVNGRNLLYIAALNDHVKLLQFFKEHNLDVNSVDDEGKTPLMVAASCNAFDAVCFLVESGANINTKDKSGLTALFYCFADHSSNSWNTELARYLTQKGANIHEVFDGVFWIKYSMNKSNLLHIAIVVKDLERVRFLVEELNFDVNEPDGCGNTPLMLAKKMKLEDIQEYLESKKNEDCK